MQSKGTHKQNKEPTEWEKIFENHAKTKGLFFKIYNQLTQLNKKKTSQPKQWEEDLNRHFSKKDMQMANKPLRRCSSLTIIREIQYLYFKIILLVLDYQI